jgi:uncharacterized repeat protein (TIGR01451 family)
MMASLMVLATVSALAACGDDRVAAPPDAPNIDLQVTKTANRGVIEAGDTVRFTVVVRNGGPLDATNVFGGDTLPTGLSYESHTQSQGAYSAASGVWTIGSLTVGAQATLTILARGLASAVGQTLVNQAGALSTAFRDSVPGNDSASASVQVTDGNSPPPPPPPRRQSEWYSHQAGMLRRATHPMPSPTVARGTSTSPVRAATCWMSWPVRRSAGPSQPTSSARVR